MFSENRPKSGDTRPSSITRSIRGSFSSELEILPPEDPSDRQQLLSSLSTASNSSSCYETVEELPLSEVEEDVNQNKKKLGKLNSYIVKPI